MSRDQERGAHVLNLPETVHPVRRVDVFVAEEQATVENDVAGEQRARFLDHHQDIIGWMREPCMQQTEGRVDSLERS